MVSHTRRLTKGTRSKGRKGTRSTHRKGCKCKCKGTCKCKKSKALRKSKKRGGQVETAMNANPADWGSAVE